jgi:hypothetical protein
VDLFARQWRLLSEWVALGACLLEQSHERLDRGIEEAGAALGGRVCRRADDAAHGRERHGILEDETDGPVRLVDGPVERTSAGSKCRSSDVSASLAWKSGAFTDRGGELGRQVGDRDEAQPQVWRSWRS